MYKVLVFSGAIPFILAVIVRLTNFNAFDHEFIIKLYSLSIISFVAGSHWGLTYNLKLESKFRDMIFIISNIVTLFAWLSTFAFDAFWLVSASHIVCFSVLMIVDLKLNKYKVIDRSYFEMRKAITAIVVLCLLLLSFWSSKSASSTSSISIFFERLLIIIFRWFNTWIN